MNQSLRRAAIKVLGFALLSFACLAMPGYSQGPGHAHGQMPPKPTGPWLDPSLSPDDRAALVLKELTLDEKITLIHGEGLAGMTPLGSRRGESNGGVGFTAGIPRLGIPGIDMSDAAYGVRSSGENGRYSTALPANVAAAASWDTDAACEYGELIGTELRAQGYNMSLGGGVDLDPRAAQRTHL